MFLIRRRTSDGGPPERDVDGRHASDGDLERHLLLSSAGSVFVRRIGIESPETIDGRRAPSSIETTGDVRKSDRKWKYEFIWKFKLIRKYEFDRNFELDRKLHSSGQSFYTGPSELGIFSSIGKNLKF